MALLKPRECNDFCDCLYSAYKLYQEAENNGGLSKCPQLSNRFFALKNRVQKIKKCRLEQDIERAKKETGEMPNALYVISLLLKKLLY